MKKFLAAALLCLALPSLAGGQYLAGAPTTSGQASTVFDTTQLDALLHAVSPPLLFSIDDSFSVQVYGLKEYDLQASVGKDGTATLPLIGRIEVAGLTLEQLQTKIASLLRDDGMVQDAQVTVRALNRPGNFVTVSGNVTKAATISADGKLTVIDYLTRAGAFVDNPTSLPGSAPNSSVVVLVRPSLPAPVAIPLGSDPRMSPYARILLFAGDELRVSKVGVIYIVGAFKLQGIYPLRTATPTTVVDAVALGGGIGYEADRGDAHIIRTIDGVRTVLHANVSKILSGKEPDIALQSEDILYVPTNQFKAAIKGGGTGLIISLATSYLIYH